MSRQIKDIIHILEEIAPKKYAEKWDNIGLQVGSEKEEISKILIALDVTEAVIAEAIEEKVQMIITHHPLIFSPIKKLVTEEPIGALIHKAIKNNINIYVMHTNADIVSGGLNDYIANKLGLEDIEILEPTGSEMKNAHPYEEVAYDIYPLKNQEEKWGIGRVGKLEDPKCMSIFIEDIKHSLDIESVKLIGKINDIVEKISIVNGSGADYIDQAFKAGCDCLITGDIKYHDAQKAIQLGINIIDAGHFGTEIPFIEMMTNHIQNKFEQNDIKIEIVPSKVYINPYQIV